MNRSEPSGHGWRFIFSNVSHRGTKTQRSVGIMSKSRRSQHNGKAIVVKHITLCLCVSV